MFGFDNIFYYRNSKNKEVDFVVELKKLIIESKYVSLSIKQTREEINRLNQTIKNEFKNYVKIMVNKETKGIITGWELMPFEEFMEEFM